MTILNKIAENTKHSLNCGINLNDTMLLDDNYLGLNYQIVECQICKKQYIIFRSHKNIYIESFTNDMKVFLDGFRIDVNNYLDFEAKVKQHNMLLFSNINDIIAYPIGKGQLIVYSIQDLEYGTEKKLNLPFYDAINYININ